MGTGFLDGVRVLDLASVGGFEGKVGQLLVASTAAGIRLLVGVGETPDPAAFHRIGAAVAGKHGFATIVRTVTVATTGSSIVGLASGTYYWRVAANGTCAGTASAPFSFSVSSAIFNDGFELGNTNNWSAAVP